MRFITYLIACLIFVAYTKPLSAQTSEPWYSYTDTRNETTGYKDAHGKIKVPARFGGLSLANVFRNIIAVTEYDTGKSYYLLKNGKQIGKDSLYVWDMTYDCEQEDKIRFRDPKTDKVGYFAKDGRIAIPALFSDARPFYNGLAIVVHSGKRVCADGTTVTTQNPCEHWSWDGITAMIDDKGNLLADSLDISSLQNLNWYSLQISNAPPDTTLRHAIKAKDGRYYSFVDYEKEFNQWFYTQYLNSTKSNLLHHTFDEVCIEGLSKKRLRKFVPKKAFAISYYAPLQKKLQRIKANKIETRVFSEQLNYMIFDQPRFKAYYTDCGEANIAKYPLFEVITSTNDRREKFQYQEHFSFLRTADGYKLIEVAWKHL
jgi:hypothetical protein